MSRLKIIYIGGWGRSGSSVLANVLGSHTDAASVGELRYIWDRAVIDDKRCGCDNPFKDCSYWQSVFDNAQIQADVELASKQMVRIGSKATFKQMVAMLTGSTRRYRKRNITALAPLHRLYQSAADIAQVGTLVDASKTPPYAINLLEEHDFDLYFIHLIRDPRAVAYSWSRKLATRERQGELLPRYSSFKSARYWAVFNLLALWFKHRRDARYLLVRYEDFCSYPHTTINSILEHCGMTTEGLSWPGKNSVEIVPQHSISGNPSRFNVGEVSIRPDNEWRDNMTAVSQRAVTLLCAPLLRLFGYRFSSNAKYALEALKSASKTK